MPRLKKSEVESVADPQDRIAELEAQLEALKKVKPSEQPAGLDILAQAIAAATTQAIQAAKPVEKKTIITYKGTTPWSPPAGEAKLKLKRKMYVHSMLVDPEFTSNPEIALLNKVRPGNYFDGFVEVTRRKDKGLNIHWPIKTVDQRMRLAAVFGINTLTQLLQKCVDEAAAPKREFVPDEDDF